MKNLVWTVIFLANTFVKLYAQDQWKDVYSESAWAERDKWQKPDELIRYLNLKRGDKVADIGCHEGYMTFKLSAVVGAPGKVYAVDVAQAKLDKLNDNLEKRNVKNIVIIKGDYDDPKLPINSLDAVIIVDTYHELDDHVVILKHVMDALKSGGRLVLCEPIADERRRFSRAEQEGKHELGMDFALEDLKKAGFIVTKKLDPFINRIDKGDKMWILVAVKN